MKYTKGSIGRIFLIKFDDQDILLRELSSLVKKERVQTAALIFLGALKEGDLVTGPKKPVIPPEPNKVFFGGGWEVMGMGTVFTNKKGPQIHIHTAMGKKLKALVGCVRADSKVFLVIEAVLFELKGVRAGKEIDPKTGLNLLRIIS